MADELAMVVRRLDAVERNHTDLAKSVTAIVEDQRELRGDQHELREEVGALKTQREVDKERDRSRNERFDRIEKRLDKLNNMGWWVLTTFGAAAVGQITSLITGGGNGQ